MKVVTKLQCTFDTNVEDLSLSAYKIHIKTERERDDCYTVYVSLA